MIACALMLACSEDPVLEAARREEAAEASPAPSRSTGGARPVGGGGGGHPIDGGAASGHPIDGGAAAGQPVPDEHQPGVAEDPPPGVPVEPPPVEKGAGVPEEPEPGDPSVPPPGEKPVVPGAPGQGGAVVAPTPDVPSVIVSGRVVFDDWRKGAIRVDVFDADPLDFAARKQLVSMAILQRPGAFEARVPIEAGRVWLSAFNDEDADGRPGPVEPTGVYVQNPVEVAADVEGVELGLVRPEPPQGEVDVGL